MEDLLKWLFDGFGTMLVGIALGSAGTLGVQALVRVNKTSQKLRSFGSSSPIQAGRDVRIGTRESNDK